MAFSGFLYIVQNMTTPMGIGYVVWTGIGIARTFLVGVVRFFNEAESLINYLGIALKFANSMTWFTIDLYY